MMEDYPGWVRWPALVLCLTFIGLCVVVTIRVAVKTGVPITW